MINNVRTPIVESFLIEDPSLEIQIENPFLFSKNWVLGVFGLVLEKIWLKDPQKVLQENSSPVYYWCANGIYSHQILIPLK